MILDKRSLFHKNYTFNQESDGDCKLKMYVGKNDNNIREIKEIMEKYILFIDEQKTKQLLGLDFEFNKGVIAMAQLNLDYFTFDNKQVILLFDPNDKLIYDIFKKVVLNQNIWIILHGSESLDLPYLTKQLIKNPKEIVKFFKNLIDTKYLCDYSIIESNTGRCKINYFLEQEKIISKEFLESMLANEKKMGPIYLLTVDVKKLSNELLLYSAYDVIFLPELIRKIKKKIPFIEIIRILQINFMMKYGLLKQFDKTKDIISKSNNAYFKKIPTPFNKLVDIVNPLIEIAQSDKLKKIKLIQGFKKIIELVEKSYLFPIFINNKSLTIIDDITKELKPLRLPIEIESIFKELQKNIKIMIN